MGQKLLIINLLMLNVVVGFLVYKFSIYNLQFSNNFQNQNSQTVEKTEFIDKCGQECQKYIDSKIADIEIPTPAEINKTVYVQAKAPVKSKVQSVSYVSIPGSGQTIQNDWTDIAGTDFYFNPNDYSGLIKINFEAGMRLFNGNGMAYVRLFDVTHGIGVQGSEVQTNSQTTSVISSGDVSFWSGRNLIRVQAKSLTADTAMFDSGRLRIVSEN